MEFLKLKNIVSEINSLDKINKGLDTEEKNQNMYWNVLEDSNRNYENWSAYTHTHTQNPEAQEEKTSKNKWTRKMLWDDIKWSRRERKCGSGRGRKNTWSSNGWNFPNLMKSINSQLAQQTPDTVNTKEITTHLSSNCLKLVIKKS